MAGNSQRKGAMRKEGTKKGQTVGSGGQRRRGLEPKGPTPKATERTKHPAAKRARAADKKAEAAKKAAPASGSAARKPTTVRPRKDGVELIIGRNAVLEALRERVPGTSLHVQTFLESDDRVREILTLAAARGLPMKEASRVQLDKLTEGAIHQGVALTVPPYNYADAEDLLEFASDAAEPALIVALDGVTDPRNLGAIVRSAAAFGAHGVLIQERRAAGMTAAAWKTSAGAAARVPVAQVTNLNRALQTLAKEGCMVVGLAAGGESLDALDAELARGPVVLVIGSEGAGLSRLVAQTCDVTVGIPMTSTTESLNAGVAAGVALYAISSARRATRL
jgi:23S rRNA (guanosine2251-2'-O)-methyltransferase